MDLKPRKPADLDSRIAALLEWMGAQSWAERIVLGGALALKHYVNYRTTYDCDAWWTPAATTQEKGRILSEVEAYMSRQNPQATILRQRWGDVDSVKILENDQAVFSFQIADRSVQLQPYQESGWGRLLIESLTDNVGSKMCALVERGAPRDFLDVFQVCGMCGSARIRTGLSAMRLHWHGCIWKELNSGVRSKTSKTRRSGSRRRL
jgi:hypothetical protein